jgi:hypothetical protein
MRTTRASAFWLTMVAFVCVCARSAPLTAQPASGVIEKGSFRFAYDERGVSGLAHTRDPYGALVVPVAARPGQGERGGGGVLVLTLSYRVSDADWTQLESRGALLDASAASGTVIYSNTAANEPLKVVETYRTDGRVFDRVIELTSASNAVLAAARPSQPHRPNRRRGRLRRPTPLSARADPSWPLSFPPLLTAPSTDTSLANVLKMLFGFPIPDPACWCYVDAW